jgi:hypothetical protein
MAQDRRKAGERPLRRRVETRRPRKTFLIFCEGARTEPEYLNALKMQPSVRDVAAVDLRVETGHGGSAPKTLVALAADARDRAMAEDAEIDEFWCVFDVEWPQNHPSLKQAIEEAARSSVQVAISNPCFELWLILHFQDQGAWLDTDKACKLRRKLDGSMDKGLDAAKYMDLVAVATSRAARLDERHQENAARFPNNNPSSGLHRLLAAIEPSRG